MEQRFSIKMYFMCPLNIETNWATTGSCRTSAASQRIWNFGDVGYM